mmetsp:Transcript_34615/g.82019  ORF Transcript_34615/g.82019 Transcript_34615/m.82019 type:complete len:378 (-) Transcript_34615:788-1921(-)
MPEPGVAKPPSPDYVNAPEPSMDQKYRPITLTLLVFSWFLAVYVGCIYTHIPAVMQHRANQALATNATIMGSNATHIITLRMQRAENTSMRIQEHVTLPGPISFGWRVHAWKAIASLHMCYKYVHSFETDKLVNHQRCLLITNGTCAKTEVEMKEQHHANTKQMVVQGAHEAEREANRTMSVRKDEMLKVWFHDLVQHDDTEIWSRIMPSSWTSTFRSDDHDIQEMLETIITCDEVLKVYNVTAEAAYIARVVYSKIPITCALIFWGGVTFWTWWYDTDAFNDHWWSIYTKMKQSASQAMDFCITCRNQYLIYTQTIAFVLWVFFVAAILYVSVYGYPFTIQENLGIVAKVSTFFSDVMKMFGNILTQFFEFCSSTW